MDIGTAKPSPGVLSRAPHELIDIRDPTEAYSASLFVQDALRCIRRAHEAGRLPVLVGGTMLYFKALVEGLSPMPEADLSVRADISLLADENGWEYVHSMLAQVDPITAKRLKPTDSQRIQRALEVYVVGQIPMSTLQEQAVRSPLADYRTVSLALVPTDRGELHRKIALRFNQMLSNGFIEEVERLKAIPGLNRECPAVRAVGYRQIWEYLDGMHSHDEMVEKALASSRQLAKRQLTWIRNWPHPVKILPSEDPHLIERSENLIKGLL